MGRLRWPPWTLWVTFLLLGCPGSSSHYFHNFYIGVSEPGQGLPQFIAVSYVDDQPITHYDSDTQRKVPVVPWMRKVEKDDAQYWDRNTEVLRGWEQAFQVNLVTLGNRYNQSNGFHSFQLMYGCEVGPEGRKGGYDQFGYDGRDFLSFDKETLSWTAADAGAQVTKRKLERDRAFTQHRKAFLEEECVEWLKRYLDYGKEALQRTEPPVVTVTRQAAQDGQETLICQAHGFYPKEIDTFWRKDREDMEHATLRRDVAPNSDGTYHAWLSIDVDPQDRDHYWCHVEHASLPQPLVLAWEEPANMGLIVGAIVGAATAVLLAAAGILFFILKNWRKEASYKAAPKSDQDSASPASA
ncbi:major histocompatibility complex class I-related gene protein-like isoform X2 [Rhineura floridana]|uniref:major histocompatibility complex class I-related gene protein-like isoform X2 n=1 Tax=Rhineura floridana TaxID=261503 RepID=UPI002AC85B13|nr:major histocompatibility complex class I-related gene protein-like isoform X2 [Rhineura floridana]